jgi:hypothetical protein
MGARSQFDTTSERRKVTFLRLFWLRLFLLRLLLCFLASRASLAASNACDKTLSCDRRVEELEDDDEEEEADDDDESLVWSPSWHEPGPEWSTARLRNRGGAVETGGLPHERNPP